MKMYIPELGTSIRLTKDWTFDLLNEVRNTSLAKLTPHYASPATIMERSPDATRYWYNAEVLAKAYPLGAITVPFRYGNPKWSDLGAFPKSVSHTIKKGTVLTVDRIYIRKGAEDFSSITFKMKVTKPGTRKEMVVRFFARLNDINQINFELV